MAFGHRMLTGGQQWPLLDHFVMTAIYATVTLIGAGILGGLL